MIQMYTEQVTQQNQSFKIQDGNFVGRITGAQNSFQKSIKRGEKSFKSIKFQNLKRSLSGVSEEEEDPTTIRITTNVEEVDFQDLAFSQLLQEPEIEEVLKSKNMFGFEKI